MAHYIDPGIRNLAWTRREHGCMSPDQQMLAMRFHSDRAQERRGHVCVDLYRGRPGTASLSHGEGQVCLNRHRLHPRHFTCHTPASRLVSARILEESRPCHYRSVVDVRRRDLVKLGFTLKLCKQSHVTGHVSDGRDAAVKFTN